MISRCCGRCMSAGEIEASCKSLGGKGRRGPNQAKQIREPQEMYDVSKAHALRSGSAIANSATCTLARLLAIVAAIFTLGLLLPSTLSAQPADPPLPSSLIVKLASGLSADDQAAVIDRNGGIQVSAIPALRLHVVEVPTDELDQILANYRADPQV